MKALRKADSGRYPPALALRALALPLAVLLAAACAPDRSPTGPRLTGGDDYPNGLEALGKKSAGALRDSGDWNSAFMELPDSVPGLYDTMRVPGAAKPTKPKTSARTLSKPSALPVIPGDSLFEPDSLLDTVETVVDSADSTLRTVRTRDTDSLLLQDSVVTLPPALPDTLADTAVVDTGIVDSVPVDTVPKVVQVAGTVTHKGDGRVDGFKFSDGDGDGLLSPQPGDSASIAKIELSSALPTGEKELRLIRLASGADGDFNTAGDNILLESRFVATAGADTLETWELLDADGDGAVVDFSQDSNVVDWVRRIHGGTGEVRSRLRLVAFPDGGKNYVVYYFREETGPDGAVESLEIYGDGPDSIFQPAGVAHIVQGVRLPEGELAERVRAFDVKMDSLPGSFSGNRMLRYRLREDYREGEWSVFRLQFIPQTPVPAGSAEPEGFLEALLVREAGEFAFSGARTESGFEGHVVARGEGRWRVRYGADGAVDAVEAPQ